MLYLKKLNYKQMILNWYFEFKIKFLIKFLVQIVLCGGGTKIPKLRDAIQAKLPNADMLSSINGDEVIALGAARQVNRFF